MNSISTSIEDFSFSDDQMPGEGVQTCDCDNKKCEESSSSSSDEKPGEGQEEVEGGFYANEPVDTSGAEGALEESLGDIYDTEYAGGYAKKYGKKGKKGKKGKRGGYDDVYVGGASGASWVIIIVGIIIIVGFGVLVGLEMAGIITWNLEKTGVESFQSWGKWTGLGVGTAILIGGVVLAKRT